MLYQTPDPTLTDEQEAALALVGSTDGNLFVGGPPGAGKSTVMRAIRKRHQSIMTATTGSAAMNIGGITIDSLFSLNRDNWEVRNPEKLQKNMSKCPRIIMVDEGSAMGLNMAKTVEYACKLYGKRLVIFGDLAQSAPVKDGPLVYSELFLKAKQVRLVRVHRQSDPTFLLALQDIRVGGSLQATANLFQGLVAAEPDDDSWVRLYATNSLTNNYNRRRLGAIQAPETIPMAAHVDLRPDDQISRFPLFEGIVADRLASSRLAHGTAFRQGARVILTRNIYDGDPMGDDPDVVRFVNGDAGVIEEIQTSAGAPITEAPPLDLMAAFSEEGQKAAWVPPYHAPEDPPAVGPDQAHLMLIRLDRTGEVVMVPRVSQDIQDPLWSPNKPIARVWGFPVKLGWASTIHSAQGLTLDRAYVDMGSICQHPLTSRHGLAYVALSRVRTLEGLRISGWYPEAIYVDPAVRPYI